MNFRLISRLLSRLFAGLGVAMLSCIPWGWGETIDAGVTGLLVGAVSCAGVSGTLGWFGRRADDTLRIKDALATVSLGWFGAALLSTIPFLASSTIPQPADALFEATSGITTTGASILSEIEALPDSIQLWRLMTHWLGGLGIVVIFVALFPQLGVGAKHLFKSEVPGPITEGLRPKIKATALTLWWIYVALTAIAALSLWGVGLPAIDALVHAMSTIATGGFSNRDASVGAYDNAAVEYVICFFMYAAGINFALHYAALSGRLRSYLRNTEWRFYTVVLGVATLVLMATILETHDGSLELAFRKALFQTLAICTTTGFVTDDYGAWPVFGQALLVFFMFTGGCAGSTSGGMKISRILILWKAALIEITHTVKPHAVRMVKLGRSAVRDEVVKQVFAYAVIFFVIVFVCMLTLALEGQDLITSFAGALACVGNVGPGLGTVGPAENYGHLSSISKVVLSVGMMLGRLEFFTVLALVLPNLGGRNR